jgi:type II secretory pathway pseudopilin PulG
VEVLVVVAVISVLSALTLPALQALSSKNLAASGNQISDLAAMARQNSISKNAYTAIIIKTQNTGAYSCYATLQLTRLDNGVYAAWQTLTPWQFLPKGIVFYREPFSSPANFLSGLTSPPSPFPEYSFEGQQIDLSSCAVQIYQPDGTLSAGQPLRLRLVEGSVTSAGNPIYTHLNSAGNPANYYDLVFVRDTGQTKIER